MSITKKLLSVFLSVLMVLSSVTVGLTVFAADAIKTYSGLDENHQALAAALQVAYVVDLNNYKQSATRDYAAYDNEEGDIAKAAEAFYKCVEASADAAISESKRYSDIIKAVETTLKTAMGKDYTTNMNKVIGFLCGNGSVPSTSLNYAYKLTVIANLDEILSAYSKASDVPDTVADKATLYTYTQASNVFKSFERQTVAAGMNLFKDFAKIYSAEAMAKNASSLTKTEVDHYVKNGQKILDDAKIMSQETIFNLLGDTVTFDAAQTYLNQVLVVKSNEYVEAITALGTELDGKELSDYTLTSLKAVKTKLDAAEKLYKAYVDVQKEAVKASHDKYDEYLKFYNDSFNYNTAIDYAEAIADIEKYSQDSYKFTKEELSDVKKLLDAAEKVYKTFKVPVPDSVAADKATYDKALANYNAAVDYYNNLDYYLNLDAFIELLENQSVLDIPKTAEITKSNYLLIIDDFDGNIYKAEKSFINMINMIFANKKASNLAGAVQKIGDDLKDKIGVDAFEEKNAAEILNCLYGAPAASSATGTRYVQIEEPYLFKFASIEELLVPDEIKYTSNDFTIRNTSAASEKENSLTDETAQAAFSGFANLFTNELLNSDIEEYTFDELSLIRRKASIVLDNISNYSEKKITHFIESEKYSAAQVFFSHCEEAIEQKFNAMIDSIVEKYGGREVTAEEARDFFNEAAVIDKAYSQLSETVKASEAVSENMERLNELKASVKLIVDKADAEEFIEMVKIFENKYPKKDLGMDIYDAFNADIKLIFDFYGSCSEETRAMEDVVKASEALTGLNEAMTEIFRAYRFEVFKKTAPEQLDPWYTGNLENAQIKEFTTFDIAEIKQIIAEINSIYSDLSDEARIDSFVVNYMAIVSMLQERITLLTNPPEFHPYTVEYPDNVTKEAVLDIISRLDNVIAGDLISGLVGKPLDEAVDGLLNGLLTADIVNTLVKALYPMVADALGSNASLAGMLNINVLPKTLAKNIKHYPNVKSALEAAGEDWNAVDWEICDWVNNKGKGVNNLDTFIDALGESLMGIVKLLQTLLNGKTLSALVITIPGNQGYEKDILPLLELLGCNQTHGLVDVAAFNASMDDVQQELRYIINPLLNRIKELLRENTVSDLLELIANLSFVISNDMLYNGFADLVSPLKEQVDLVQTLKGAGIDLTNIIGTVNKLISGIGIKLPVLNWAEFAGIGTYNTDTASLRPSGKRNHIDADKADVLVQLLYYVCDVINANKDAILRLLGDSLDPEIKEIIVKAISKDKKALTGAVLQLLTPFDTPDYIWNEFNYSKTDVSYSGYTSADVKNAVDKISSILNNVINLLLDGTLNDFIAEKLYTGEIIQNLFSTIYGLLDNPTIVTIFSLISITDAEGNKITLDISKDAIADNFKDFKAIRKAIYNAESISAAIIEAADWEVETEEDFVNAIAAILAPVSPILTALLAGKGMEVCIADGAVKLYGANGYGNAVKPFLDALTCESLSVADFTAQASDNYNNTILNIINPLLKVVNKVASDPLKTATDILPHISLFIDNNGIQTAVEQLLAPLNNILGAVSILTGAGNAYEWLVDDLLSGILKTKLNWANLQNQIVPILNEKLLGNIKINEELTISLKLNAIDWGKLSGCLDKNDTAFVSNTSDTAMTLVDYVWRTVKTNEAAITDLIKSLAGDNYEAVAPYLEKILMLESTDLVRIVVELTKGLDASSYKADWSFLFENYTETTVKLPQGVSSADIEKAIDTISGILNKVIELLLDGSLNDLVDGVFYTDEIMTMLAKAVFSLGENSTVSTVAGVFGIDLSKEAIVELLKKDYSSVSKAIKESESLGALDTSNWKWNVTDKESFVKALATILRPFAPALNVLLNGGELNIAGVVDFKGANGYENAVKPLLDALGCETVSAAEYAKDAEKNSDNLLLNIVNPLLNLVDEILANPVEKISEILPQAANFIDRGGIQYAVESLLYPVTNLARPIISVITDETVFDFILDLLGIDINWKNLQNDIISLLNNNVLKGIHIGGKEISVLLPKINWRVLAGCGTLSNGRIKADTSKELVVLLRYIFKALESNKAAIKGLIGNNATINQIIDNVLSCGADRITKIVVRILLKMKTVNNASWSYRNISASPIAYTENLGRDDFIAVLEQIDPMINELFSDFAGKSLTDLVTGLVYTNNIVNTLAKLIYTNLEKLDIGVDIHTILSMLDVDISTGAVAEVICDYRSASKEIAKCSKWSDVKFDNINWGFQDGNRAGFVNALSAILRPLFPVLRAVLSADDLVVLDSITIKGGNGYNTAVVPIAEALGINENQLVSVASYVNQADSDKLLTNILNPLLDRVEEVLDSPVSNLTEILPNVAYFIENDGIYSAASNLIKPVTNILDEIAPIYELNLDLSMLRNLDLAGIVNSLLSSININGKSLGIKLSDIDLMTLAGRGSLESYTSVRTYNGNRMQSKRVVADKTAVLLSVLRYIVHNLKTNLDAINNLLSGLEISDDVLEIINTVLEALATENVDAVIELLVDILFNINSGEIILEPDQPVETDEFIPFIPGNFYWVYWVVFAGAVAVIGVGLFFILKNKKSKADEHTDVK